MTDAGVASAETVNSEIVSSEKSASGGRLRVRVPGSSANLGPGFDVLGMAVSLWADVEVVPPRTVVGSGDRSGDRDRDEQIVDERHPATVAFRAAGGRSRLAVRCAIPSGRGLGFSGAVRVAGVCLGLAESNGVAPDALDEFIGRRRQDILDLAADLEGHADNVAASLFGGVTAAVPGKGSGFEVVRIPLAHRLIEECALAVWVPSFQTSTATSRRGLAPTVRREDAVFNIAQTVRLALALVVDDSSGLLAARSDRLHQDQRLEDAPLSNRALETMIGAGALTGWLSGSGPTVAAMCENTAFPVIEKALAGDEQLAGNGRIMCLRIDDGGLHAAR